MYLNINFKLNTIAYTLLQKKNPKIMKFKIKGNENGYLNYIRASNKNKLKMSNLIKTDYTKINKYRKYKSINNNYNKTINKVSDINNTSIDDTHNQYLTNKNSSISKVNNIKKTLSNKIITHVNNIGKTFLQKTMQKIKENKIAKVPNKSIYSLANFENNSKFANLNKEFISLKINKNIKNNNIKLLNNYLYNNNANLARTRTNYEQIGLSNANEYRFNNNISISNYDNNFINTVSSFENSNNDIKHDIFYIPRQNIIISQSHNCVKNKVNYSEKNNYLNLYGPKKSNNFSAIKKIKIYKGKCCLYKHIVNLEK